MIKKLFIAATLTVGLAGYPQAQEAVPSPPMGAHTAPIDREVHQHPVPVRPPLAHEVNRQPAPSEPYGTVHYTLIMVSFINNGNPQVITSTTQTSRP